ncbi:MAG: lamin tail domain-containing protein [Halobacteriota archaeon]|nr:lamin tail domain-containing protein [Halobacteriota archaeon]
MKLSMYKSNVLKFLTFLMTIAMLGGVMSAITQASSTVPEAIVKEVLPLHDIYIKSDYTGAYGTGIRIDNGTEEKLPLDDNLTISEAFFIKFKVVNNGTVGPEDTNISVIVGNGTWNFEIAKYSNSINSYHLGNITWNTTDLEPGDYTITVKASIPIDDDWTNNEGARDVVLEETVQSQLSKIEVIPSSVTLDLGDTQPFTATGYDQYGKEMMGIIFDWSSSNGTVGTVDGTGFFTANETGITTVNATNESVIGFASVTVSAEPPAPGVVINEFVSKNATEWVELYNNGSYAVDLAGWTLEDEGSHSKSLSGTIASGGYMVFNYSSGWLNNNGDIIYLNSSTENVDRVGYGSSGDAPAPDVENSAGRYPDGVDTGNDADDFREFEEPTPGEENIITSMPTYGVSLSQPVNQTVYKDKVATYEITVTNTGNQDDTFTLSITNPDGADTAELNPSSIELNASETVIVLLNVSDSSAGTYNVTVTATSNTESTAIDTAAVMTTVVNNPPELSSGSINPSVGNASTTFTYSVTYTDSDNEAPAFVNVIIDGTPYLMTVRPGGDEDYTNGEIYEYSITLSPSDSHTFKFTSGDGTDDATGDVGVHNGPIVTGVSTPYPITIIKQRVTDDPVNDSAYFNITNPPAWVSLKSAKGFLINATGPDGIYPFNITFPAPVSSGFELYKLPDWNETDYTVVGVNTIQVNLTIDDGTLDPPFVLAPVSDLKIGSPDISFSRANPTKGDTITIIATVHNIGGADTSDFTVSFFDGTSLIGDDSISVTGSSSSSALVSWTAVAGNREIKVIVDSEGVINETDETNNEATETITVKEKTVTDGASGSTGGGGGGGFILSEIKTDSQGRVKSIYTEESSDGKAKIIIPEGTTALDVGGKPLKSVSISSMDLGGTLATYNLGPNDATFDPKVTLVFEFDSDDVPEGETVVVKVWDDTEWVPLETTVDISTNTATVDVSHFTVFALFTEKEMTTLTPTLKQESSQAPTVTPTILPPTPVEGPTVISWIWVTVTIILIVVVLGFVLYIRR